jgi:hypothetical protein
LNKLPPETPKEVIEMIQSCWHGDREKRKTATECVTILEKAYKFLPYVNPSDSQPSIALSSSSQSLKHQSSKLLKTFLPSTSSSSSSNSVIISTAFSSSFTPSTFNQSQQQQKQSQQSQLQQMRRKSSTSSSAHFFQFLDFDESSLLAAVAAADSEGDNSSCAPSPTTAAGIKSPTYDLVYTKNFDKNVSFEDMNVQALQLPPPLVSSSARTKSVTYFSNTFPRRLSSKPITSYTSTTNPAAVGAASTAMADGVALNENNSSFVERNVLFFNSLRLYKSVRLYNIEYFFICLTDCLVTRHK